jgi:hypothetical protein
MVFQNVEKSGTPSTGSLSVNSDYMRGEMCLLYVKPTTATTVYDFRIVDAKSRIIREFKDVRGTLRETNPLTVYGIYTFTVVNATVDEAFQIYAQIKEIA